MHTDSQVLSRRYSLKTDGFKLKLESESTRISN